jgi:hypothetical protein
MSERIFAIDCTWGETTMLDANMNGTNAPDEPEQSQNAKTKVLLSFVGQRDPYSDSLEKKKNNELKDSEKLTGCIVSAEFENKKGSIISIFMKIKPDIVYLFPSGIKEGKCAGHQGGDDNETLSNAQIVEAILTDKFPAYKDKIHIKPMMIHDVTSLEEINTEFSKKTDSIIKELKNVNKRLEDYDFYINCSSGTPQMKAFGYIAANSGIFPGIKLLQVKDPRFISEKVTCEQRVDEIEFVALEEGVLKNKILSSQERQDYYSAMASCNSLCEKTGRDTQKKNRTALVSLFGAYIELDLLNYKEAERILTDYVLSGKPVSNKVALDIIDEQKEFLKKLISEGQDNETPFNLTDLLFNMKRCFIRGAYADVLARFRRILEGSAYHALRTFFGINPINLDDGTNNKENLKILDKIIGHRGNRLDFSNAFKAIKSSCPSLEPNKPDLREFINENDGAVIKFTKIRDKTLVAHGMQLVDRETAENCIPLAEKMLVTLVPDSKNIVKNYPFTAEKIKELVDILLV